MGPLIEAAVKSKDVIDEVAFTDLMYDQDFEGLTVVDRRVLDKNLHTLIFDYVDLVPKMPLKSIDQSIREGSGRGAEAMRLLHKKNLLTTVGAKISMRRQLGGEKMKDTAEVMSKLTAFEDRVRKFEVIDKKVIEDDWKVGFVLDMLP